MPQTESIRNESPRVRSIRQLREWIREGQLPVGEPLPAENELADTLRVSRTTIRAAVKAVEEEGLIQTGGNRRRIVIGEKAGSDSLLADTIAILTHLSEAWPAGVHHPIATGWERFVQISLIDAIQGASLHALTLHLARLKGEQIRRLVSNPPRGLVLMRPALVTPDMLEISRQLRDHGVPVVAYGYPEGLGFDCVTSDHAAGCEDLCRWLISQGRRRILRVWEHTSSQSRVPEWRRQRDAGYERAMQEAGLEPIPLLDIPAFPEAFIQSREDFEMRARLILGYLWDHFSGPDPVDAILALTDGPSFAITAACRLLGKEPNRDVIIAGYDNYWQDSPNRQWEPAGPAVTIDKRNIELGRELMTLLQARADGTLPPEPQVRLLKPVLQVTG